MRKSVLNYLNIKEIKKPRSVKKIIPEKKAEINSPIKTIEKKPETPIKIIPQEIKEIEPPYKYEPFEKIYHFDKFEKAMDLGYYLNNTGLYT